MFLNWIYVEKEQVKLILDQLLDWYIRNPDKWTDAALAEDKFGNEVEAVNCNAVKFGLIGIIDKLTYSQFDKQQAEYVACATRDFLNIFSSKERLFKVLHTYEQELEIIKKALVRIDNYKEI